MTKAMQLPFGELPGSVNVWIAAGVIFAHGWDPAEATGQPTDLDPETAEQILAGSRRCCPARCAAPRDGHRSGPGSR